MDDEPLKADGLSDFLQCHLSRTDAPDDTVPLLYQECSGSVATPSPPVTPKPTLPVAVSGGVPVYVDSSPWQNGMYSHEM